ncbi:hypothetical protein GCM10023200_04420 [Actinomycetospora chlora]|uniref:DUF4190 domain-containing protein n=1 Tax=Actinomycetospora chlora TaxID=663608 RepID=A0ABP9A7B7_9PSEU
MTQISDNQGQQAGVPAQGQNSVPQQPMPPQFVAPPAPNGMPGYWQWHPNTSAPVFVVQQPQAPSGVTSGTAIFALLMSLLWLGGIGSVLGLIFGIIGARECDRTGQAGHGVATAAALLGFFGLLFSPVLYASF